MFCQNCGNELGENDRFCNKCGTQIKQEERPATVEWSQQETPTPEVQKPEAPAPAVQKTETPVPAVQRKYKRGTGVIVGAVVAAGAILWITLIIMVFIFHSKADNTLDNWKRHYEDSYMPEEENDSEQGDDFFDHGSGNRYF